jgi:phosphonate transport system substrate-binding protein
MGRVVFTSCLAANTHAVSEGITAYASRRLKQPVVFAADIPWQERVAALDDGRLHGAWMCGLLYTWKVDGPDPELELLASPVMDGPRYGGRPVYFSDMIVRRDGPWQTFADLRGTTLVYNETSSFSGYHVVWAHLARLGEGPAYFGRRLASGSHLRSLEMVLAGAADVTALDSTVLDAELRRSPGLGQAVRAVATLGPNPAPPWVISRRVPQGLRDDLRGVLLDMHRHEDGRRVLASGGVLRFRAMSDGDYGPIREAGRLSRRLLAEASRRAPPQPSGMEESSGHGR